MKLIIDIDDEMVCNDIKNKALEPTSETDKVIINALYNGTPVSNEGDLINRSELKKAFDKWWGCDDIPTTVVEDLIDNAPTVAESCKELHEVATERPQTFGCFNCKYETKMLCEEPCMVCNNQHSEWRQKE